MISTSLGYHLYGNNLQQSIQSTAAKPVVSQAQTYYNANIGKVKTVDDLVNNYKLLSYATQAYGLSDMTYAKALLKKVLTSDLSNSKSVANQLNDSRYVAFAKAFSFNTDGSVKTTAQLQTSAQVTTTENLFAANTTLSAADAKTATTAYASAVSSMTSLSQLVSNSATLGYVLTAYGIDPTTAASTFEPTLESDLSKSNSYVNSQAGGGYVALTQAININADGTAVSTVQAQTTTNINATTDAYTIYAKTDSTSQSNATTETNYYLSKIGGITKASDLTTDARLVAYVKQAYQLPNSATAKDIQSALTSDTTDGTSFARQSPYPGFLSLAKAFNFSTTGDAQNVTQFQTAAQQQTTMSLYAQRQTSDTTTAAAATAYYKANIGSVTSVADLEKDPKLLSYVKTAYNINANTSNAALNQILENTNNSALEQAVSVDENGAAISTLQAQASTSINATTTAYSSYAAADATSQANATTETNYYRATIGGITTASQFTSDSRLVAYVKQAYQLPSSATASDILSALTSDTSDPNSFANQSSNPGYASLAKAFNFSTAGNTQSVTQLQTATQQQTTTSLYAQRNTSDSATAIAATTYYNAHIGAVTSVADLEKDSKLLSYVETAYNIDSTTSTAALNQIMEKTGTLAHAVSVNADGTAITTAQAAQTGVGINATTDAYSSYVASDAASQANATTETNYYRATIGGITTASQFTSDSRLVAYVKQAYQLPSSATSSDVLSALTSDTSDPNSFANQSSNPGYASLAKAFNFSTAGNAQSVTQLQTAAQQQATTSLYAQRNTSDPTTAAAATAYYKAHIGAVTSVADLEKDPKLLSYVKTAYNVDANTSNATLNQTLENTNNFVLNQAVSVNVKGAATVMVQAQSSTSINATATAYSSYAASDATSQADATTETNYYRATIGGITTASQFASDSRLVAYVKQAYQLPDTATASDIQSALTSDPSDPNSFASQSSNPGYVSLAKAFNFSSAGNALSVTQLQTAAQQQATTSLYTQRNTSNSATATAATAYYNAHIGAVTSVADLEKDPNLLSYLETAYNIDSKTSTVTLNQIMENAGNVALTHAVSVNTDGTAVTTVQAAQTGVSINATTDAYTSAAASDATSQANATSETNYYRTTIGGITTASQFTSDSRLVAYVKQAYNLPDTTTASDIQSALTSDTSDPNSFANQSSSSGYLSLAKAFNFSTSGEARSVTQFQTAAQQRTTASLYDQRQTSDSATSAAETAYYKAHIGDVKSVADLEKDPTLLSYVETAYGINANTSAATLNQIMENTTNVASGTAGGTLLSLRLGLNVDTNGNATAPLTAQSTTNLAATITAYTSNTASDAASQAAGKKATLYYQEAIKNVTSVSDLLADPKLVAYVEKAYSIPTKTTAADLRKILTSDLSNLKSVANTKGSNYATLAGAFDFTKTGLVGTETQGVQSKAQLAATNSAYVDQQMETDASAKNPGIGLALYLQFNASKITDAYSILADKKLTTIFQTALGLSSQSSYGSIDAQAATINSKIKLSDLKDPKKLSAFIQRFSIMYDLNPPATTTPTTATSLITGSDTQTDPVTGLFGSTSDTPLTTASLFTS